MWVSIRVCRFKELGTDYRENIIQSRSISYTAYNYWASSHLSFYSRIRCEQSRAGLCLSDRWPPGQKVFMAGSPQTRSGKPLSTRWQPRCPGDGKLKRVVCFPGASKEAQKKRKKKHNPSLWYCGDHNTVEYSEGGMWGEGAVEMISTLNS